MKKFLTILSFFCVIVNILQAQNTLDKIGLTNSTTSSVAYSLRQLSTSYTGPLVRIKVGTSFYDVYPDANSKNFSLSSKISAAVTNYNDGVAAFGSNMLSTIITSSTNATVVVWYDQSGNGVNVLSSTSTAKIISLGIINTIYGQPTIYFSGSTSLLTSSNTVDYSAQSGATVNVIAQNVSTTSAVGGIFGAAYAIANPGYNISYGGTGSGYLSDGAGCEYKTSFSSTDPQLITNIFTTTTTNQSNTYINGVLKTNTGSICGLTNTSGSKIYIGSARGYGPFSFDGNISEAIIFPKQLVDAERNPLETNQTSTYFSPGVSISSSATNNTSCSGASVTFTANIYNFTSTPTYQWYKNNVAITGANSATYSTTTLNNNDQIYVSAALDISAVTKVTSNLIANLDAGNTSSYSGSGNTWTDLTGNGNKVTLSGTGYSNVNGGGISFNSLGTGYGTHTLSSPPFNGDFTWSSIFKAPDQSTNGWDFLYGVGSYNDFWIATVSGKPAFSWGSWFNFIINTDAESQMVTGNYYMLTLVRSGNKLSSYLQAAPYGVGASISGTIATSPISVGKGPSGEHWENGIMNVMLLYNKALTQSEITQNYNSYATRFGLSAAGVLSNKITVTINQLPDATIVVNGDACINKTTLTTTLGLTSYAWYKDNVVISGATTNSYTPIASGSYLVQVSTGTCSNTSTATTIYNCAVGADGKMLAITNASTIISPEGGANFGTGRDIAGKLYNITSLTTINSTIGTTTAILGGVISPTNATTSSIGLIYSTDVNFGSYSSTTIQSNVAAGTYTSTITGLNSLTTYYAKSFIINKAGTSYGSVINFTTSSPPVAVGSVYGGGIVFYILQSGDNGYDANVQHGLIAPFNTISRQSTNPLPPIVESQIGKFAATISGATSDGILLGKSNTDAIIVNQGSTGTYAALYCRNYSNPTTKTFNGISYTFPVYNDWYMPSIVEINKFRAYVWSIHPSRGVYVNYGNNVIYYNGTSGNGNDYAWGKYLSSSMTGQNYKLYYLESGNQDGSTAYNGWSEFDRLVVMPIRSF